MGIIDRTRTGMMVRQSVYCLDCLRTLQDGKGFTISSVQSILH